MKKNLDQKGRFRGKIVAFRMSQEENRELDIRIAFSGMNKQDYLISKVLDTQIIVRPNIRILKVLEKEIFYLNQLLSNTSYLDEEQLFKLAQTVQFLNQLTEKD